MTHLSDGCAELTLKDLLQRLELVTGDITRLLQLLQQLDSPGNIWQRERERENVCVGGGKNAPFNYIKPCKRCWSKSMGGIMEIDSVKASSGARDRIAVPSVVGLHWLSSMHKNKA